MVPPGEVGGPRWFSDSRLNFAENLLRFRDDRVALVSWTELGPRSRTTYAELYADVARLAQYLRGMGVRGR